MAWASLEYRFLVDNRSYLYVFGDGAYILTPEIPRLGLEQTEVQKLGYGIGVAVGTSVGVIGLSVAFGDGDTFSTAKLHVQLINEF
jgi:hypothetical protein